MPKSRDFLLALLPGFSERIHPGIFWSRDKQKLMIPGFLIPGFFALSFGISRDIPGFIFCSNGYILSLSNIKFSSLNANIMLCFRTFLSEHLFENTCFRAPVSKHRFQNTCFWTPVSEQLFQNICYRTNVSELIFQNIFEPIVVFFSKYLIKYEKIMFPWQNMETSFVCKAKFSIKTRKLRSISDKIS